MRHPTLRRVGVAQAVLVVLYLRTLQSGQPLLFFLRTEDQNQKGEGPSKATQKGTSQPPFLKAQTPPGPKGLQNRDKTLFLKSLNHLLFLLRKNWKILVFLRDLSGKAVVFVVF